jgi:hypothetical protein
VAGSAVRAGRGSNIALAPKSKRAGKVFHCAHVLAAERSNCDPLQLSPGKRVIGFE